MPSEAQRAFVRIAANYTRVLTVVVLGLVVVRLLLIGAGNDGWALIALLGSTVMLASMVQEIMGSSLIRELGAAYHGERDGRFRTAYNAALVISATIAVLSLAVFAVLWAVIPLLRIPDALVPAARWLVVARGVHTFTVLMLSAPFNMYKVTERMVAHNAWLILSRLCYLAAAVTLLVAGIDDAGRAVTVYAVLSSGLVIGVQMLAVGVIVALDRRLVPAPRLATAGAVRSILHVGGWNAAATAATTSHHRVSPLIMNLAVGLSGNLVLGLAIQLTVAVRRLAVGMTEGLDAVSARLSMTRSEGAVRTLMHHATRLHGLAVFPVAVGVVLMVEPLLRLWVGAGIGDPRAMPMTIALVRIMAVGMAARAVADGWMRILYGAGHVTAYAPIVFAGGIANPVLAVILLAVLPEHLRYTAVGWSFSIVLAIVHGVFVPAAGARALGVGASQFFVPLWRPLAAALICAPVLVAADAVIESWDLLRLFAVAGLYGVLYAGCCWLFVADAAERSRVTRAAAAKFGTVTRFRGRSGTRIRDSHPFSPGRRDSGQSPVSDSPADVPAPERENR